MGNSYLCEALGRQKSRSRFIENPIIDMKEALTLVKVGGKIVENEASLSALLTAFNAIRGPKLLVHGGGRTATDVASRLGIETHMVGGRRITDAAMLDVVTMVYGGLVNKRVVAGLQARGINAVGLTGADMDVMRSRRRPVVRMADGTEVDYGFVGDVEAVDGQRLADLIRSGVTPVLAPLTHDGMGSLLNTNADTIAGEAAKALAQHYDVSLVFCFEHAGVLADPEDETSVIHHIGRADFARLVADGVVVGGMIPKIENSLAAVEAGVARVIITRADTLAQTLVQDEQKDDAGFNIGTIIS